MSYKQWKKSEQKVILSGKLSTEELATKFNVSHSAIYAVKSRLAQEGKGFSTVVSSTPEKLSSGRRAAITRAKNKAEKVEIQTVQVQVKKGLTFIINGINLEITGDVKDVKLSTEVIKVNY